MSRWKGNLSVLAIYPFSAVSLAAAGGKQCVYFGSAINPLTTRCAYMCTTVDLCFWHCEQVLQYAYVYLYASFKM